MHAVIHAWFDPRRWCGFMPCSQRPKDLEKGTKKGRLRPCEGTLPDAGITRQWMGSDRCEGDIPMELNLGYPPLLQTPSPHQIKRRTKPATIIFDTFTIRWEFSWKVLTSGVTPHQHGQSYTFHITPTNSNSKIGWTAIPIHTEQLLWRGHCLLELRMKKLKDTSSKCIRVEMVYFQFWSILSNVRIHILSAKIQMRTFFLIFLRSRKAQNWVRSPTNLFTPITGVR